MLQLLDSSSSLFNDWGLMILIHLQRFRKKNQTQVRQDMWCNEPITLTRVVFMFFLQQSLHRLLLVVPRSPLHFYMPYFFLALNSFAFWLDLSDSQPDVHTLSTWAKVNFLCVPCVQMVVVSNRPSNRNVDTTCAAFRTRLSFVVMLSDLSSKQAATKLFTFLFLSLIAAMNF